MKTNVATLTTQVKTHEGGRAMRLQTAAMELTRAVSTCLLFENTFYESGNDLASRIVELCNLVSSEELSNLAVLARNDLKLRHVPLFLCRQLTRLHKGKIVGDTIAKVIQRPDELSEFLSLYWRDGKHDKSPNGRIKHSPLSKQVKRGLSLAFIKFNEYQLSKWNRPAEIKLRDVLFLCHAKPRDMMQVILWKKLVDGTLEVPDTWEVALSTGKDKKETWERLLSERKLGYIALLMNLRNMTEANVNDKIISGAILSGAEKSKTLPFRFISAAKHAPQYASVLSEAMLKSVSHLGKLDGDTLFVVDVSGSMDAVISAKSQMTRIEVASALAVLFREMTATCRVFTFSSKLKEVQNYRGLPLVEKIYNSQDHSSTYLGRALQELKAKIGVKDRILVITDEQAHDEIIPSWCEHSYLVNVAPYKPALDTDNGWTRINGWSERLADWIHLEETGNILGSEEDTEV